MPVYLDHNATTPLHPEALEAMQPHLTKPFGNPASVHRFGRAAHGAVQRARVEVAELVGCRQDEVIFTSGGTESDNLAVKGAAAAQPGRTVLYGATEHPAVLEAAEALRETGTPVEVIPHSADGHPDWPWLEQRLGQGDVGLVCLMAANNETGVILDTARAAELAHAHDALLHVDVVQAAGKIALDFAGSGADMMALSAHKLFGPRGVGALILRAGTTIHAQMHGGGHEGGMRSGTLNAPGIVGFGAACRVAARDIAERNVHCRALRDRLEAGLQQLSDVTIFAAGQERLSNTCQFALHGYDGEAMVMAFDREGFAVSSGSACQSEHGEPSHVLLGMGLPRDIAKAAVRVSVGPDNSDADIDALLSALARIRETPMAAMA
ncbi:cysteine desulfurase family protein [Algiphilus aromaticivorans]|jgi:cysteine desulfurase|uniref:cysteine desulfurase family protein n=1 Tax=Algiphilus aromaticivorans TaxID=382454 RepID=UPI0005C1AF9B|nr:cysteine desulfurase family protein [Algiphilus aromaticivorans]